MKQSDLNHLRRLLGWVRCDIGQAPAELQQTMIDVADGLGHPEISEEAKARMVETYRRAEAVPLYVRTAVKALEKALAAAGREPGAEKVRPTAETRANTGFDPGAAAGREPAATPLQNHPDAAAWPVACRDTPAAPPTLRRATGSGRCECSLTIRLAGDGCRHCQPQTYIDSLEMCAEDNIRTIEQLQVERAEQARLLGAGGERELALMARIDALEAARFAYASEFPSNEDGDPDVDSIHQNIRALKSRLAQVERETAGPAESCRPAINLQVMQEALRLMPSDEARRVAREAEAMSGKVSPEQYVLAGAVEVIAKLRAENAPVGYVAAAALAAGIDDPEWRADFFRTAEGLLNYFHKAEPVAVYATPQASAAAFAKLQSAYVGACDRIGELLAEKQACADDVRNALEVAAKLCFDPQDAERIRALKQARTGKGGHLDAKNRLETHADTGFVGGHLDTDTVVLPPLPKPVEQIGFLAGQPQDLFDLEGLRSYAREAVLADRQQRAAGAREGEAC